MNKHSDPKKAYITIASRKFAKNGFHGTSLAAVAADAGVTKQALLHFFGTKERLYAEVLQALALRLSSEVEASSATEPVDHLTKYLLKFGNSTLSQPKDAQLVIRALLDSDAKARTWPMKSYLDRLIELVCASSGKPNLSQSEALAWLFPVIGAVQYLAISTTAITGMYGKESSNDQPSHLEQFIKSSVSDLAFPDV
ncbi:MAG: TetR/AcrR family transcriptional regulator [Pseudomonadota bacterium]